MAGQDQDGTGGNRRGGRFSPGRSGNPSGRPRRTLEGVLDSATIQRRDGTDGTVTRRDGWQNRASGHGTVRDRRRLTRYGVDIVTDIEAQQLRRSEFLAAAIIEDPAKEAFKRGWHLKCEDKELDVAICKQAEHLGMDSILIQAAIKSEESGGCGIFPVLTGALDDVSKELDESRIEGVHAFHVFEPQELTPVDYYTDITDPKFRMPKTYRLTPLTSGRSGWIQQTIIHETRLVIFNGIRVSVQTQPGQREGWGDSCLCRPWSVISDFGLAWGSAATLLHEHGKGTLKKKGLIDTLAQADGPAEFDKWMVAMQQAWTTLGMSVIDAEDSYERSTGTLAGVSDALNEFKVLMSAAARRPVSVLMGQSQSGLRTGDDDTINWYSTVEGDRKMKWARGHERLVRLMLLATSGPTGGKEPESWAVEYHPLHSPTEKEIADTRKTDMERAEIGIDNGVFSADDVAESFYGGDTYSGDIHIDWDRRSAQASIDQATPGDMTDEDLAAMGREPNDFSSELDGMDAELNALDVQPGDSGAGAA